MYQNRQYYQGFTLTEILVVISLIVLLAGFLLVGFKNYANYQQYNQAVNDVVFVLKQARVDARSAVADESHGIYFSVGSTTKFIGDTYNAADSTNDVHSYGLVTIEFNLTGGVDTIVFDKLTGIPSATGTVVVTGTNFSASTTIQISDAGVIQ